jgi:hypothetical protein
MWSRCRVVPIVSLLAVMFMSSAVIAEDKGPAEEVPEIRASHINPHPPVIDGKLDDIIWRKAERNKVSGFRQFDPDEGADATERTEVAVAYDENAIYVAFWCYDDQADQIGRQLVRRDRDSQADAVTLYLDPYHDHQTGLIFNVNASGVQRDWRLFNDNNWDSSWDGIWESNIHVAEWGWSAEIRIPYHCLRFNRKPEHTWGINFSRDISRRSETSTWAFRPSSVSGTASTLGHLTGLTDIEPVRQLQLMPYAVTDLKVAPADAAVGDGREYSGNMGLDLKYGLSSNLVLDATFNPDFGQVELDAPVLNLTAFESRFPERRPFFLEGADLYRSPFELFYSRRIGQAPQNHVADPEAAYYTDYPSATKILGAAKLTGKLSSGTTIAFMSAVTNEEEAEYRTISGLPRQGVVEPMANYTVLRVKQDIMNNSNIGGIMTMATMEGSYPATTGGLDWRFNTPGNNWSFTGQTVFSRVDAMNTGFGADINFNKNSGKHFRTGFGLDVKNRVLDLNDLGLSNSNNRLGGWTWMQWRTSTDWLWIRNSWTNLNISGRWNLDGYNLGKSYSIGTSAQFINNWHGGGGFAQQLTEYDDSITRGHGLWSYPASWHSWIWLDTDRRKAFSVEYDYSFGNSRTSPWWRQELLLRYRPASNTEFSVKGDFTHDFGQLDWVANPDAATTIFADRDQDIFRLDTSVSYLPQRNLSLQLSAAGFLTGLAYNNFRPYLGGDQYGTVQSGYNRDYNYSALNSTMLLRWEYNPGSTLYLVWTRSCHEVDGAVNDLDLGRDLKRLFSSDAENVFLAKLSYWFNV